MPAERWGTFSVRDHTRPHAFVIESLLYDRLVIPVPPPDEPHETERWRNEKWKPDRLADSLEILGVADAAAANLGSGLAVTVAWDEQKRAAFEATRDERLRLGAQATAELAYGLTPLVLAKEFQQKRADGSLTAHAVAAYPSPAEFVKDARASVDDKAAGGNRERDVALLLARRFLMPTGVLRTRGVRLDRELLQQAVDLARSEEFKANRRRFYEWEAGVIAQSWTNEQIGAGMHDLLEEHARLVKSQWKNAVWRRAWTAVSVGAAVAGGVEGLLSLLGHDLSAVGDLASAASGAGALGSVVPLRRPAVGDAAATVPAAVFYQARRKLELR